MGGRDSEIGGVLGPVEKARVYEQTLAAEYLRFMRAWIGRNPDEGFAVERVAGTEDEPAGVQAGGRDAIVTNCLGLGLAGAVTDEQMDAVEAVFSRCDAVPEVEALPYADSSLLGHLERRGYGVRNYLQVFWRGLSEAPVETVAGVEVRRVDKSDAGDVALAVRTIAAGMESTDGEPSRAARIMAEQVASCVGNATFLALVDGRLAGGSSAGVWDRHTLVGPHLNLYGGSTLPWARRRGVQRALMLERLRWGFGRGARTVSLDCKPAIASEWNARRLGFELVCTKGVFVKGSAWDD